MTLHSIVVSNLTTNETQNNAVVFRDIKGSDRVKPELSARFYVASSSSNGARISCWDLMVAL